VLCRPVFRELAKDTTYDADPRIIFQFEAFSPFSGRGLRGLQVPLQILSPLATNMRNFKQRTGRLPYPTRECL
jgi:hypothetical protein